MAERQPTITELTAIPQMDTGAPMPLIFASEDKVLLSYLLAETDQQVIIRFDLVTAHVLGGPGDETLHGHPLYKSGLGFYGAFAVKDSDWVAYFAKIASVHHGYDPTRLRDKRTHYIFTFHDSTFECIAGSIHWDILKDESRVSVLSERLTSKR